MSTGPCGLPKQLDCYGAVLGGALPPEAPAGPAEATCSLFPHPTSVREVIVARM